MINNKSAFTIAELILTTVIMAVVCVIAPVIILKREVKPNVAPKLDYIARCLTKCVYDARTATIKDSKTEHRLDYNKNSNAFYTIELIGGGAGGTSRSAGYAGESKVIYIPSLDDNIVPTNPANKTNTAMYGGKLTGYYLMEAGSGGKASNSGLPSRICTITPAEFNAFPTNKNISCNDKGKMIIAQAEGGIRSNETIGNPDTIPIIKVKLDDVKDHRCNDSYCGSAGKKGEPGINGVITIK